ncbi:MAG: hypothetical protein AB7S38_26400 [Vulcanimicrobiota bacterium]
MEVMKTENRPQAQGAESLEEFITTFNLLEAEADLFSRCKDTRAFRWWDIVRYTVQFAVATEKNLIGARKETPPTKSQRLRSLARHIAGLGKFIQSFVSLKSGKIDTLYVSTRSLQAASAPFLEKATCILYVNKTGTTDSPHQALSKLTIDFLLRCIVPLFRVPPEVALEASRISAAIRDRFDVQADLSNPMLYKYRQARASLWMWGVILNRLPALKRILFVNDDTLKSLVSLAHGKGIETIEIQHGYMGKAHFAYSYPSLPSGLSTLPDKILITRDTGDIVVPIPKLTANKAERSTSEERRRDIDILVGGSPTRSEEMRQIVEALAETGLCIAVKLHPAQTEESSGLRPLFPADLVTIFDGGEDFQALANRSHIYIPANPTSTTVFEAVEAGADLITINYDGQKITSICDPIATAQVDSFDSLRDTVINHLERRLL